MQEQELEDILLKSFAEFFILSLKILIGGQGLFLPVLYLPFVGGICYILELSLLFGLSLE
jgi:hypothetical protein